MRIAALGILVLYTAVAAAASLPAGDGSWRAHPHIAAAAAIRDETARESDAGNLAQEVRACHSADPQARDYRVTSFRDARGAIRKLVIDWSPDGAPDRLELYYDRERTPRLSHRICVAPDNGGAISEDQFYFTDRGQLIYVYSTTTGSEQALGCITVAIANPVTDPEHPCGE